MFVVAVDAEMESRVCVDGIELTDARWVEVDVLMAAAASRSTAANWESEAAFAGYPGPGERVEVPGLGFVNGKVCRWLGNFLAGKRLPVWEQGDACFFN